MQSQYSIAEAIEFLKISKVTLYRWLNDDTSLNKHTKTIKGKRYITKDGIVLLQERHNLINNAEQPRNDCNTCVQLQVKDKQLQDLQDSIKVLQTELSTMNDNIIGNRDMFNSLIELNRNNQILLRKALPEPKVSFWDRIFKRNSVSD